MTDDLDPDYLPYLHLGKRDNDTKALDEGRLQPVDKGVVVAVTQEDQEFARHREMLSGAVQPIVAQTDRDAAKQLLDQLHIRERETGSFRSWDETVQAFARHRHQSDTGAALPSDGREAGIDITGAQWVLQNKAKAATDCLAKPDWRPTRAHIEGCRNAMNEALEYLADAQKSLAQPVEAGEDGLREALETIDRIFSDETLEVNNAIELMGDTARQALKDTPVE